MQCVKTWARRPVDENFEADPFFFLCRKSAPGKATHAVSTGTGTHTYTDEEKYVDFAGTVALRPVSHSDLVAWAVRDKHTFWFARLLLALCVCFSQF